MSPLEAGFVSRREAAPRARIWERSIVHNVCSLLGPVQAFERVGNAHLARDYKTRARIEPELPADARIRRAISAR